MSKTSKHTRLNRRVAEALKLEEKFHALLSALHIDKLDIEDFLLPQDVLDTLCKDLPYGSAVRTTKGKHSSK